MARKKYNKFINVFQIFFSSIKHYFLYLDQCVKQLLFPVFGQLLSIIVIFTLTFYLQTNNDNIRNFNPFFNDDKNLIICFFIVLSPFFLVLLKAIYDYMIVFCSFNLLFFTTMGKSKVKNIDFAANNNTIKRKLFSYVILLLLVSLIYLLFLLPSLILIIPIIIAVIYLSLCFQVFTFEGDISPINCIKRSIQLVKGNVIPTIIMILLCYFVCYEFLTNLFLWSFEKISVSTFFIERFETFFELLPVKDWNANLCAILDSLPISISQRPDTLISALDIAMQAYRTMIAFIIISFTLPFRCCCFTSLYKLYDSEKIKENSKQTDEIIKRATGKKRKN